MYLARLILSGLFVTTVSFAQGQSRAAAVRELRTDLDNLLSAPEWRSALLGVCVASTDNAEHLYRHNDEMFFTPASTNKLFTTAVALATLGPEYRFRTTLYLDGRIQENGEFAGNIIVRGSGDPTWSTTFGRDPLVLFDQWVGVLDSLGIRSVKGNIIGDDDVFDDVDYATGWAWDDLVWSYGAQVNGLGVADNSVRALIIPPLKPGGESQIRLVPETDYVRVMNGLRVVDSTGVTEVKALRDGPTNIVDIVGTIVARPRRDTINLHLAVENPTLYFASLFRDALVRHGIRFRGALIDVDDWNDPLPYDSSMRVAETVSPPLSDIVAVINHVSHNLGADILCKTIGREVSGDGSFEKGADVIRTFVQRNGIGGQDLAIVDGSGLSRLDLCTPQHLVNLLNVASHTPWAAAYKASLAAPGEPGTLQRRMVGTRAERSVRAKTGGMNNVSTLAGYVTTRDGETLSFAMMADNTVLPTAMVHNLQDLICMRLASFSRK